MVERGIRIAEAAVRFRLGPQEGEDFSAGRIAEARVRLVVSLPALSLSKGSNHSRWVHRDHSIECACTFLYFENVIAAVAQWYLPAGRQGAHDNVCILST